MTTTSESLTQVAAFLYQAGLGLQEGLKDYQSHRDSVALLVNELRALIESAKSDVSITSDVLQRIEQASQGLSTAQQQTQEFMAGVADVLAKAYEDFRISVSNSLNLSNHDFQQTLSSAVGLLSASIKELDDVLAVVPGTPRPPES
jgi:ABC-type transporter Mla subunit MlaD